MLGKMPLVSMSDRRLGGMENSSLRYFSAMRALEFSTSRIVRPSFSRRVRRLFPAGSIERRPLNRDANHTKGRFKLHRDLQENFRIRLVTKSEHAKVLFQ